MMFYTSDAGVEGCTPLSSHGFKGGWTTEGGTDEQEILFPFPFHLRV